jgi:hypothetical protein
MTLVDNFVCYLTTVCQICGKRKPMCMCFQSLGDSNNLSYHCSSPCTDWKHMLITSENVWACYKCYHYGPFFNKICLTIAQYSQRTHHFSLHKVNLSIHWNFHIVARKIKILCGKSIISKWLYMWDLAFKWLCGFLNLFVRVQKVLLFMELLLQMWAHDSLIHETERVLKHKVIF